MAFPVEILRDIEDRDGYLLKAFELHECEACGGKSKHVFIIIEGHGGWYFESRCDMHQIFPVNKDATKYRLSEEEIAFFDTMLL